MTFLHVEDLTLIHLQIIDASGGSDGVRDLSRLESAVAAPFQAAFGKELYPTIFEKSAVLMRAIIADLSFVDGNKRTGMMTALIYLNLNGYDTSILTDTELEDFAVQVAVDHLDIASIAAWLKAHSRTSGESE